MGSLGINLSALIVQLLAFGALILLLRRFAYRPILNMLDQRAERIRESEDRAERIERQLAETEVRNQQILDEARREAQGIVARAREIGDTQIAQAREVARGEADKQLQQSLAQLRAEEQRVRSDLRREFADLVVLAAGRVVRQELDPQKHQQLISQTLRDADSEVAADK